MIGTGRAAPIILAVLGLAGSVFAEPGLYSGRENRLQVAVPRHDAAIEVDGVLDESVWLEAARLSGFSQYAPVDGRGAENPTDVLVWYSPTAIHFGIQAQAATGSVRATLANRDKIESDDAIFIFLSTFNDGRQAWMFGVNPLGVQTDGALVEGVGTRSGGGFSGLATGREEPDLNPDFVFDSKGRLVETGFEVEIRIPFKTLRFQPQDKQDWGIHVIRRVQSLGHEDSWVPASRAGTSFLAQSGTLVGLEDLRRGLVLDLNPVVTARADGAPTPDGWSYDAGTPEVGGNVRWGVTRNLTLNGTVNPDFSQVETDVTQFAYDPRLAIFYPEKRPFFLDGIEQFATPNQLIYTRRIVAPLAAAKLTGKVAGTTVAALSAVDDSAYSASGDNHPVFNILRVQRDLGGSSKAAFVYTDKIEGGDYNRVLGADTRLAFANLYTVDLQVAASRTRVDDSVRTAPLWEASFNRNGRKFGFRYLARGIDEEFQAAAGFIRRAGIADLRFDHRWTFYGQPGSLLESFSADVVLEGNWVYSDFVAGREAQDKKLHFNNNLRLRGGWRLGGSLIFESFGVDRQLYADYALESTGPDGAREILPFTGTPRLYNRDFLISIYTPQYSTFSGSVFSIFGRDENFFEWSPADIVYLTLVGDWRPTDQIRVNAQYQLQHFKRRTDGTTVGVRKIPRLKLEYQLSRYIFLRLVGEYDWQKQDDLRDDSRTDLPILIRDPEIGTYERALGFESNRLRVDFLFSYQPTPGTVIFAGYGSMLEGSDPFGRPELLRTNDGFFFKVSYLFRL